MSSVDREWHSLVNIIISAFNIVFFKDFDLPMQQQPSRHKIGKSA